MNLLKIANKLNRKLATNTPLTKIAVKIAENLNLDHNLETLASDAEALLKKNMGMLLINSSVSTRRTPVDTYQVKIEVMAGASGVNVVLTLPPAEYEKSSLATLTRNTENFLKVRLGEEHNFAVFVK